MYYAYIDYTYTNNSLSRVSSGPGSRSARFRKMLLFRSRAYKLNRWSTTITKSFNFFVILQTLQLITGKKNERQIRG